MTRAGPDVLFWFEMVKLFLLLWRLSTEWFTYRLKAVIAYCLIYRAGPNLCGKKSHQYFSQLSLIYFSVSTKT